MNPWIIIALVAAAVVFVVDYLVIRKKWSDSTKEERISLLINMLSVGPYIFLSVLGMLWGIVASTPDTAFGKAIFDVLGLEYAENQAGLFLWGRLPEGENCYDFCDRLLYDKGIFLTPGGIFGSEGNRYMRLSLCAPQNVLETVLNILK